MKKIITIVLAVLSVSAFAQKKGAYCEPSLSNLKFTDAHNGPVDAGLLVVGNEAKFTFTLANQYANSPITFIPAGTCMLKVTLGTHCFLMTDLQGAEAPLPNYFHWTIAEDPLRQTIATGTLYRDFPVNMARDLTFSFMPSRRGGSLITAQLLITNDDNASRILSDLNPGNNIVSKEYANFSDLNVDFVGFSAKGRSCALEINWQVNSEVNISRYVIETSGNGSDFVPVKTVLSNGTKIYNLVLDNVSAGSIYVRVKAIALTGQSLYAGPVQVNNICAGKLELTLYPNPASTHENEMTIFAKEGILTGTYNIQLLDAKGMEVNRKEVELVNATQVKYNTGFIPGGSYQLVITGKDGVSRGLKFIKQ